MGNRSRAKHGFESETWMSVLASFQRHRCYRIYRSSSACVTLFGVLHYLVTAEGAVLAVRRVATRREIERSTSRGARVCVWSKINSFSQRTPGAVIISPG